MSNLKWVQTDESEACKLPSKRKSNKDPGNKMDKPDIKKLMTEWIAKMTDTTMDLPVNPFQDSEPKNVNLHWIHSCSVKELGKMFFLF